MKEQHPIDEHFKAHLADQEVQPSRDLWADMEPRLNERPRRRGWFIGVAASITLAVAVSTFVYDTYKPIDQLQELPITREEPTTTKPSEIEKETESPTQEEWPTHNSSNQTPSVATDEEGSPSITPVEDRIPEMVGQDAGRSARRYTALNNEGEDRAEERRVLADATTEASKNNVGVRVKFDPTRYLNNSTVAESTPEETIGNNTAEEPSEEKVALGDYAEAQWNNLVRGENIVLPEKGEIKWPSLDLNLSPLLKKFNTSDLESTTEN